MSGDGEMTRFEEELLVERVFRPRERVRLTRHVVTESVTYTVEVRREELRVEREPVEEIERSGAPAPEEPIEIILHEEQVVIEKRVLPRERVRISKQMITEERRLEAELRGEEIVLEQD